MDYNEKKGLCGICPAGCWIIAKYDEQGKIIQVRADNESNYGMICKLGEHSPEIIYSEHRLKYPMKRKGVKGNYDFERISWDEAYEIIVNKLNSIKKDFGPEATAIYTGRGSFDLAMCDVYQPKGVTVSSASSVLFPFGSPNTLGVGALCYVSFAMIAPHVTMGGMYINMFSDIENSDLIVVWGANPATDCPPYNLKRILSAHKRGAEIVVIDPRKTMTARLTDAQWIPIRSGTDGALALSLAYVMIDEELYDETFVKNWTIGFDEFVQYTQHFRPEVVEKITGVSAETIVKLARKIANAKGASPIMYTGLEYSDCGVQAIRATMILWALAGQLDVPGGYCFSMKENMFPMNRDGHIPNPNVTKALGRDRFPIYSHYRGESHAIALPDAVLHNKPYSIKSLIILGGSIITSWPQPQIWRDTFNALDFLVCIDRQLTADSAYADIVLPATTMYEIESYMTFGPIFRIRDKMIDPVGESRSDFFILSELAKRLGYGHLYPQTSEEMLNHALKGSGLTLEEVRKNNGMGQIESVILQYKKWEKGLLRPDGKPGFDTPSGKFEITSSILEENGYDALPVYVEPKEGPLSQPNLYKDFPLIFNSGSRVTTDFRSQHHGIKGLYKDRPEPTVTINTLDAEKRGINDGEKVIVSTKRGEIIVRALVTDNIVNGTIDVNMGGGGPVGPKSWQDCNVNELTNLQHYDPISGFPVYKTLLCEVVKANDNGDKLKITSGEYDQTLYQKEELKKTQKLEKRIYFDHNATTPIHPEVKQAMIQFLENDFGNASSIYKEGKSAKEAIESARRSVAQLLNSTARRVVFTGCGSESNNMIIKSIAFENKTNKNHIITSSIEHPSILGVCSWLESQGFNVTYLKVDDNGLVQPEVFKNAITDKTCLVSIMMANNETGVIQPIQELNNIAKEHQILFHTDAVQAIGKIPIDLNQLDVDFLSLSGHKLYAPKGVGALYIRKNLSVEPLIHGGKQENGLRAGTENVAGIVALGKASELAINNLTKMNEVQHLRDLLEKEIIKLIPNAKRNGHSINRLPNTLNLTLPGIRGESLVLNLDQKGISLSSGSACSSGSPKPSHALLAMGLTEEMAHCSIRFSLGVNNSREDIENTIELIKEIISESKGSVRFVPCR